MTQNLIITNDDGEYCQFTVEIPDGYGSFSIDSINGTLINQCFLRVGDKLSFKLANNPIVYDNAKLNILTSNGPESVDFVSLDTFKILKIKFLPIYSLFHPSMQRFVFIINPADDDVILDDPKDAPSIYRATNGLLSSFTGRYAIAFAFTTNEEINSTAIDVTFGDSISNSKTTLEDMGSYNEAGGIIPDNLQSSTYSLGSTWRYPVSNLVLSHKLHTIFENITADELMLAVFEKNDDNTLQTRDNYEEIGGMVNNNGEVIVNTLMETLTFEVYDYSQTPMTQYTTGNTFPNDKFNQIEKYLVHYDGTNYSHISGVDYITGSTLFGGQYKEATIDTSVGTATFNALSFAHIDAASYRVGSVDIVVLNRNQAGLPRIRNATITFDNFDLLHYQYIVTDPLNEGYDCHIGGVAVKCSFIIPVGTTRGSRFESNKMPFILGKTITTNSDGAFNVAYDLYTGLFPKTNYVYTTEQTIGDNINMPLQLFSSSGGIYTPAIDDIVIEDASSGGISGIKISTPTLNNDTYKIMLRDGDFERIDHEPLKGANNTDLKVFIPLKANVQLLQVPQPMNDTLHDGILMIPDVINHPANNLTDSDAAVFFADGHETLNIEPPKDDDLKFKTFNGSVVFDRSSARILRLVGSSSASAAIGYINDILSAKMARYYFISSFDTFDTFFDSENYFTIPATTDGVNNIYDTYKDKTHTRGHSITLASCFDIIKLLSYENSMNNCMPSLTVEEHKIKAKPLKKNEITKANLAPDPIQPLETFTLKTSHYYNSAFDTMPYFGLGLNDQKYRSVGGVSLYRLNDNYFDTTNAYVITSPEIFITNEERTVEVSEAMTEQDFIDLFKAMFTQNSNTQATAVNGCAKYLPVYRVYQNANFEQSDLSITTGHMKTLFPVYLQVASQVNMHNIGYYFDMTFNLMNGRYSDVGNRLFNYFTILPTNDIARGVMRRFGTDEDTGKALSFDSIWILNYLTAHSLNNYRSIEEELSSLPTASGLSTNEELIDNMETDSMATNVQLFSKRYFDFYDNVSTLGVVAYTQKMNQNVNMTYDDLGLYFAITEEDKQRKTNSHGNEYLNMFYNVISMSNLFNRTKTANTFIPKVGEFLDFPKIIFGVTLDFNASRTVDVRYSNISKYESPFITNYESRTDPGTGEVTYYQTESRDFNKTKKQKQNVSLFGVIFKYHQLSLGWQQMLGDFQERYIVSKAKGNKHFIMTLVDEFGRLIPNMDTSQGFKNNLKLEISCYADLPTIKGQDQ